MSSCLLSQRADLVLYKEAGQHYLVQICAIAMTDKFANPTFAGVLVIRVDAAIVEVRNTHRNMWLCFTRTHII